jgi:hypothetical protein
MPVTFVRDPATGVGYSVNIAGDAPTERETARINEFLLRSGPLRLRPRLRPKKSSLTHRTSAHSLLALTSLWRTLPQQQGFSAWRVLLAVLAV